MAAATPARAATEIMFLTMLMVTIVWYDYILLRVLMNEGSGEDLSEGIF